MEVLLNVLSCFDGISAGQLALQRAGIKVDNYYASEIDKYAIQITQENFPKTIQLGDINDWESWKLRNLDLIIAGSPCQGFSRAGTGYNFDDPRSKLFYIFCDILERYKPKYFLLENVKMKKEWEYIITFMLQVDPISINSSKVSAQKRERLYWTNILNVRQPEDKHIYLRDIVLEDVEPVALHNIYGGFKEKSVRVFENKSPTIRTSVGGGHIPSFIKSSLIHTPEGLAYMDRIVNKDRTRWDLEHHSDIRNDKFSIVLANYFKGVPYNVFKDWDCIRKFHPVECERLQTLPDNWTRVDGISNTQRYKAIGNSWTVDVVAHIFKNLLEDNDE